MKKLSFVILALLFTASANATNTRGQAWPERFSTMNGSPIHRFTLTPDATTAEDNTNTAGGTAVQYALQGGERICIQAITTDAYVQVIASASMTSGALGIYIAAAAPLLANCFTLKAGEIKVSGFCTAAGPCIIKGFELQ